MRIVIADEAYEDLRRIDHYLWMRNPVAAETVADLIILRSLAAGNYLIFYFVTAELVTIARVIDGRRDIDTDFFR